MSDGERNHELQDDSLFKEANGNLENSHIFKFDIITTPAIDGDEYRITRTDVACAPCRRRQVRCDIANCGHPDSNCCWNEVECRLVSRKRKIAVSGSKK
jgi:hypothetical protein